MVRIAYFLAAVCCLQLRPDQPAAATDQPMRLAVDLMDGSHLIGTSKNESVRLRSDFGDLSIPLRVVESVRWKQDREHVVVEFPNGDHVTGSITPEIVQLTTVFGEARVSMQYITVIKPVPAGWSAMPSMDGLVLYFPFDEEPQQGTVVNKAGSLHGTQHGGRWIQRGHRGGAFQFSSGDDYITVPDHDLLRPKKLTISVWVNPDESNASSSWRGIITKASSGSWRGGYGLARYPGSPDAHFFVNYYSGDTAHNKIPDNRWTHLVGTYDEQTLTLYVNGSVASAVVPRSHGGAIQYGKSPLLIGTGPDGYGWFGKIDEVMIFNRALSADEVKRLYENTKSDRVES
jgi:hypothetical protein